MNPPSRSWPFGDPHGCDGDGCASDLDTWPLHHAIRRGGRCRLCSSCILLSHRSLYCCCCFLLIASASPSSHYDDGDPLLAPPAPTATCQVCRDAVAHLVCLHPAHDVFVCPACNAAAEGRPFTYAPPCREPLDGRAARVLVLGARIALALLQQNAAAARTEAERLAREATAARRRAYNALGAALDLGTEVLSWNLNVQPVAPPPPQAPENNLLAPDEGSEMNVDAPPVQRYAMPPQLPENRLGAPEESSEANVDAPLVQQRYAMPQLAAFTVGTGGVTEVAVAASEAATMASPAPPRTLPLFGVREVAMAAAEAARASSTPPRTLQLFPAKARASPTTPRTLQLFEDKTPDDGEEM